MADKAKADRMAGFAAAFKTYDKNNDGKMTAKELQEVMAKIGQGMSDWEIRDMIKAVDHDGSGTVDYNEFLELMSKSPNTSDYKYAFNKLDTDHDGYIDGAEIIHLLKAMGKEGTEAQVKEMLRGVDKNLDSKVSYQEFLAMSQ